MTDPFDYEDRFASRLNSHAASASHSFDAAAIAAKAVAGASRSDALRPWPRVWWRDKRGRSTLRVAIALLLLAAVATAGTLLVGAALRGRDPLPDNRAVIQPTASPSPTPLEQIDPTASPNPTPIIASPPSPDPSLTAAGVGVGPCPAMVQLLATWRLEEPSTGALQRPPTRSDGYIVVATRHAGGGTWIDAIGTTGGVLTPIVPSDAVPADIRAYVGFPVAPLGRITPAPNGSAIAVEEGDLGLAGCGDPLVRFAQGGTIRPFPVGAFQTVTDLAWAPDGSALYGILRPTIDTAGRPLVTPAGDVAGDPGTVLRWDVASRTVSDLGTPCPTCRLRGLVVSPDGSRILLYRSLAEVAVRDPDGSWRNLGEIGHIIGWTPEGTMVIDGYTQITTVDLNGRTIVSSGSICCHGNGYGGVLSPDGKLVVGTSLSADMKTRPIVVVDLKDGSQRTIPTGLGTEGRVYAWAPDASSLVLGSGGRAAGEATGLGAGDLSLRLVHLDGSTASAPVIVSVASDADTSLAWLPVLP